MEEGKKIDFSGVSSVEVELRFGFSDGSKKHMKICIPEDVLGDSAKCQGVHPLKAVSSAVEDVLTRMENGH